MPPLPEIVCPCLASSLLDRPDKKKHAEEEKKIKMYFQHMYKTKIDEVKKIPYILRIGMTLYKSPPCT